MRELRLCEGHPQENKDMLLAFSIAEIVPSSMTLNVSGRNGGIVYKLYKLKETTECWIAAVFKRYS